MHCWPLQPWAFLVRSLAAFLVALAERLPHVWDAQLTGVERLQLSGGASFHWEQNDVVKPTFLGFSVVHRLALTDVETCGLHWNGQDECAIEDSEGYIEMKESNAATLKYFFHLYMV